MTMRKGDEIELTLHEEKLARVALDAAAEKQAGS
jgi:hypothetical protein